MGMAWMTACVEWRRRWGSLALLALLVTLAGGVPIGAVAAARRADTAFARFSAATGEPDIQADGFAAPGAWGPGHDGAPEAFAEVLAQPGVVDGQRFAAVAVAATEEFDAFSFAIIDQGGQPAVPFMVEGRMFDVDDPHEGVVNEAGAAAFGVGVGDTLEVLTVGWDRARRVHRRQRRRSRALRAAHLGDGDRDHPQRGRHRPAGRPLPDARPGVRRALRRRGDQLPVHRHVRRRAGSREGGRQLDRARLRDDGYVVDFEEGGDLPEHVANGIDVEVAAMQLLAVAAGLAGLIVVAQAIARHAAGSAGDRATTSALGATAGQQTMMGVLEVAPAIVAGAFGSVVLAVGLSTLTPRGLARQAEIDPGLRIDGVVLAAARWR